jgi:lysozyme
LTIGIDVSRHQGTIDWAKVAAAGIGYCYVKATEGATIRDPRFDGNWTGAAANGVGRGAYHFFSPATAVDRQLANFTTAVRLAPGDLPPALDLEVDGQNWTALPLEKRVPAAVELLQRLEHHYGVRPLVYTNKRTVDEIFAGEPGALVDYPLWVASYKKNPPPTLPVGWTTWKHWQHSQTGTVDGVTGPVDLDWCVGDPTVIDFQAPSVPRAAPLSAPAPPAEPPLVSARMAAGVDPMSAFERVWRGIREEGAHIFPEGIGEAQVRLEFDASGRSSIAITLRGKRDALPAEPAVGVPLRTGTRFRRRAPKHTTRTKRTKARRKSR